MWSHASPSHPWFTPANLLRASVGVALATILLKALAWYLTGSVGLLSDALESFVNLAGALFALTMVTVAQLPADDNHPYGHHKAEYFSSGFEGLLIVGVSLAILWAAVERLVSPQPLERVGWGMGLSVLSSALNGLLAWQMFRTAREHRSIALEGDARHLITWTGWQWLDPLAAMVVALNILREGVALVWRASQGLMDEAVDSDAQAAIDTTLQRFVQTLPPGALRFDHVSTRRAGQRQFVSLHMHMPADWTLRQAAALRGQVEQALMAAVPGLRATIELLPTDVEAHLDEHPDTGKGAAQ
jgi:divalent metal cation (Fe/Co/Zn/Cd) transporter